MLALMLSKPQWLKMTNKLFVHTVKYISSNWIWTLLGYYWWLRNPYGNCIKFNRTMHNKYATVWKVHSLIARKPHTGSNWHFLLPDWLRANRLVLERKYAIPGDPYAFTRETKLEEIITLEYSVTIVRSVPAESCVPPRPHSPSFITLSYSHRK